MMRAALPTPPAATGAGGGGATGARAAQGGSRALTWLGRIAPRAGPLAAATAISVGGWAALAKYAYGSVVPGAVAAGLGELYAAMESPLLAIGLWYPPVEDALRRAGDPDASEELKLADATDLRGSLRPLHEGVYELAQALDSAAGRFESIDDLISKADLPTFELESLKSLVVGNRYAPPGSPELLDTATFMLTAAEKLIAIVVMLREQREAIIDAQSHYQMRRD
jgi:hypothetical protein